MAGRRAQSDRVRRRLQADRAADSGSRLVSIRLGTGSAWDGADGGPPDHARSSGGGAVHRFAGANRSGSTSGSLEATPRGTTTSSRSSLWLGTVRGASALGELGVGDLEVHEGRLGRTRVGQTSSVSRAWARARSRWRDRKLVGISSAPDPKQGARFSIPVQPAWYYVSSGGLSRLPGDPRRRTSRVSAD